ncbi:MAG: hypothetical protein ACYDBB_03215 [Armatimonadota bacterium]
MSITNTTLYAGAAEVDITPAMDIQIAGDIGRRRPVQEIRERIYAKALVLKNGDTLCCLLSIEVCYITHKWVDEIRQRAAERFGLDPKSVMIHSLQIHSAPAIGNAAVSDDYQGIPPELWWLRSGDERYNEPAVSGIVEAIGLALGRLEPVTVHVGRELDGRVAFNRRFVLRDGTAMAHPWGEDAKQILYTEGPIDPEVGVMLLKNPAGRNVAALLHHTCHPVHGYPHCYISSDWPGAWASAMRGALGADCVALVLNGNCGDIHHHNHLDPTHVDNYLRMGSLLAESACRAMEHLQEQTSPILAWHSEKVRLPLREYSEEVLQNAKQYLAEHPEPPTTYEPLPSIAWDWVYAHTQIDFAAYRAVTPYYDYEVQAIRLADSAVVALTGEPFVQSQLNIKLRSPFPYTFTAHMSNGYAGYLPTKAAMLHSNPRSFETRPSNWAKFVPEALEMVEEKAVSVLEQLAERQCAPVQ